MFDIHPTKAYKLTNANLISAAGQNPVVTNGSMNNGIGGYTSLACTEQGGRITFSDTTTAESIFYQPKDFVGYPHVQGLYPRLMEFSPRQSLYIAGIFRKVASGFQFDYAHKFTRKIASGMSVSLPVVTEGSRQLDLAYMESYILELESARIRELGKWLLASGLNDYDLEPDEQKALRDWQNGKIRTDCRKITDVFSVANTHCVLGEWVAGRRGGIPYVTASACNNSVSSYIDYKDEFKDRGNAIVIGGKTFVVTYQSEDFFSNDSHNLILRLKNEKYRIREVYLYLIGAINAGLSSQYSWGDSVSYKKIQKDKIVIPVTSTGEIDFDFMLLFVRATIKQTIRGVVEWKDREIAATKKAVAKPFGEMIQHSEAPEESDWEGRIAAFEETEK